MGKYFGTDGFRGEANINLTADHAFKVGRFLGWYYTQLKRRSGADGPARIVIGKDTRRSSYMFEYSLVGGLVASGADANVCDSGLLHKYGSRWERQNRRSYDRHSAHRCVIPTYDLPYKEDDRNSHA